MKKKVAKVFLLLVILLVLGLSFCFLPIMEDHVSGLENFHPADSTFGLCQYLFPTEDFIERFAYLEGDYHYYFNGRLAGGYATAFAVLEYDPDNYLDAKEYCKQQFFLTDEHKYQVGNYLFQEHICYNAKNGAGKYVPACQYPRIFNMFAYNDSEHTLLFIGFYGDADDPFTHLALTDFPSFYEQNFGQYYSLND